jgi:excisionase family DNA binding protein
MAINNDRLEDIKDLKLYTITELEQILGVCRRTLLSRVRSGNLPCKKINGKWRITEAALRKYVNGED